MRPGLDVPRQASGNRTLTKTDCANKIFLAYYLESDDSCCVMIFRDMILNIESDD